MAIGIDYSASAGGDILPIVKFDCRAGRMFRVDRENNQNTPVDITREFKAVFDLENLETGYINFDTGAAPDFSVTKLGTGNANRPSDKHKPGVRLMIKLGGDCSGGQAAVRELATVAKAALQGIDILHDAYLKDAPNNPGALPIVRLANTTAITTDGPKGKTTNYCPVFEIVGWAKRPADLQYTPKAPSSTQQSASGGTPPSTGGTRAAPPAPPAPPPPPPPPAQAAAEEDFG